MAETLRTLDDELVTRTEVDSSGLTGALVPVLLAGLLCTTPIADFGTALAGSFVEDAIVNGVTTKAPSQNAVFDALALKADASALGSYLTTAAAASTYLSQATAASTYLTISTAASTYLTIANAISGYQPLDADLTSWSAVTRASGFDAFATTPSSANLISLITDETGSGSLVFATSPTLVTPVLGVASATSINKVAITAPASSATLTIANGKTLTASNTLTFTGTDGSTLNVGAGGTLGTAAYVADNTLVHLAGTETVSGKKSFSGGIAITGDGGSGAGTISTGSNYGIVITSGQSSPGIAQFAFLNSAQSATLMYLQSNVLYVNSDPVMTRGATETVTGAKTFSGNSKVILQGDESAIQHKNAGGTSRWITGLRSDILGNDADWTTYSASTGNVMRHSAAGGTAFGNPTGGLPSTSGHVNAVAVYDDNSLLTCYIVEAWKYGQIDLAKWDALAPNREHPAVYEPVDTGERDEDDKPIMAQRLVKEAWTEVRQHAPARGFAKVAADRLDIDKFSQFVWENERLPAFPAPDRWADMYAGKMATGDLIQRLWETVEVMAIHSIESRKREIALTARVAALEAAQ